MLNINDTALGMLVKNEIAYRGDLKQLKEVVDDIEYIVKKENNYTIDQKIELENKLVQLIINSR